MASTGAVLYLKVRAGAGSSTSRWTGAVAYLALRDSSGQFSSSGGAPATRNLRNLKSLKPHSSVPLADPSTGRINEYWDRYFSYLNDTFLEMTNGPTLPDVADSITYSQAVSLVNEAILGALSQQANSNAQSIEAVREVVQTAALPGSAQIPPAKLYMDYAPIGDAGGGGD